MFSRSTLPEGTPWYFKICLVAIRLDGKGVVVVVINVTELPPHLILWWDILQLPLQLAATVLLLTDLL